MMSGFSGEPLTRWNGSRNMILEEDFFFVDLHGKKWNAPAGSCLNGATIPRALWSTIGAPYSGRYRKSSVIHDVAVGELCNPDVPYSERKKADRMFFHACCHEGCDRKFAVLLYIGVRLGSWVSRFDALLKTNSYLEPEVVRDNPEDRYLREKFWGIVNAGEEAVESGDLDALDQIIDDELAIAQ